jgi:hypothetical protein
MSSLWSAQCPYVLPELAVLGTLYRLHHNPRVDLLQRLIINAQTFQDSGRKVL